MLFRKKAFTGFHFCKDALYGVSIQLLRGRIYLKDHCEIPYHTNPNHQAEFLVQALKRQLFFARDAALAVPDQWMRHQIQQLPSFSISESDALVQAWIEKKWPGETFLYDFIAEDLQDHIKLDIYCCLQSDIHAYHSILKSAGFRLRILDVEGIARRRSEACEICQDISLPSEKYSTAFGLALRILD